MTAIVFARTTDGYILGADGRTCTSDTPRKILTDKARKIRIHRTGGAGLVTSSSGRATIGGKTIAEVEDQLVAELTNSGQSTITPSNLADALSEYIYSYNQKQKCDCSELTKCLTNSGEWCIRCGDEYSCPGGCDSEPEYTWTPASEGTACPCAPRQSAEIGTIPISGWMSL